MAHHIEPEVFERSWSKSSPLGRTRSKLAKAPRDVIADETHLKMAQQIGVEVNPRLPYGVA